MLNALDVLLSSESSTLTPLQRQQLIKERNRLASTEAHNPTLPGPNGDGVVSDPAAAEKIFKNTTEFLTLISQFSEKFKEFGLKLIHDASFIVSLAQKLSLEEFKGNLTLEDFYDILPDANTLAQQKKMMKEIEEEFLDQARQGRLRGRDGQPISEVNLFLKGTSQTTVSIMLMTMMAMLRDQAFMEGQSGIDYRKVVFNALKTQIDAIKKEGELQEKQYKEMGHQKMLAACLTAGMAVAGVVTSRIAATKMVPTKGLEGKELAAAQEMRSNMHRSFESFSSSMQETTRKGTDAAIDLIQSAYAPQLKAQEAVQVMAKQFVEAASAKQQDQMRIAQDAEDRLKQLAEMFVNFWSSTTRNVPLSAHQM
jgi:hypothetical protein